MSSLEAIVYTRGSLKILDQLLVPHQSIYLDIATSSAAWTAIRTMQTRGAPAIAIVAALGLAVELSRTPFDTAEEAKAFVHARLDYLLTSRPTAVNLQDAATKLRKVVDGVPAGAPAAEVVEAYTLAAEAYFGDDVETNRRIGRNGADWILARAGEGKVSVLTHCNTGSLATAGYGTALGIVRALHEAGRLEHAYCTETRPYNQGSRLTAYELVQEGMPATLITDSMATSLMSSRKIDAVIVGADRVVANGDTANKIGTHQLAIVAKHFGVPFIVASPTTTIDLNTKVGRDIVIEQRPADEVRIVKGLKVGGSADELVEVRIAPTEIDIYNPSFDVTPKDLISVVVTEKENVEKDAAGVYDFTRVF